MSNRENTLKTKEIADKLIPLMEAYLQAAARFCWGCGGGNYSGIVKIILTMSTLLCIFASDNQC